MSTYAEDKEELRHRQLMTVGDDAQMCLHWNLLGVPKVQGLLDNDLRSLPSSHWALWFSVVTAQFSCSAGSFLWWIKCPLHSTRLSLSIVWVKSEPYCAFPGESVWSPENYFSEQVSPSVALLKPVMKIHCSGQFCWKIQVGEAMILYAHTTRPPFLQSGRMFGNSFFRVSEQAWAAIIRTDSVHNRSGL